MRAGASPQRGAHARGR